MKFKLLTSVVTCFFMTSANADCGDIPTAPLLLETPVLTKEQVEELGSDVDQYFESNDNYRLCALNQLSSLDPEAPDFESLIETTNALIANLEQTKELIVSRYNYHIEAGLDEPVTANGNE